MTTRPLVVRSVMMDSAMPALLSREQENGVGRPRCTSVTATPHLQQPAGHSVRGAGVQCLPGRWWSPLPVEVG